MKNLLKHSKNFAGTLLIASVCAASVVGCSKWNQDPMTGQSADTRNGNPNAPEESIKPGSNSENIRIDTVDFYRFQEQLPGSFVITARVLIADATYRINIENLDSFQGATFDEATGTFAWTPPAGTSGVTETTKTLVIRVVAHVKNHDESRFLRVPVMIARLIQTPHIISIEKPAQLIEGQIGTAYV
ncbi:MAG: hypothetical protein EOP06_27945, partial [Proteobacteria bacterium]